MTRWLIGLDDTDNLESRGTGFKARQMAEHLERSQTGLIATSITRHQLLVDPRIPYTSHNSSACISVVFEPNQLNDVIAISTDFLIRESAEGSDAGHCIAAWEQVSEAIQAFGCKAKVDVLTMQEAQVLAEDHRIHLAGLTGTGGGVIGSLSAVGLHSAGHDGRFLWLPGLRELDGIYPVEKLQQLLPECVIQTESGLKVDKNDRIDVGDWVRPIFQNGHPVLLVEKSDHVHCDWILVPRDRIKQLSN